MLDEAEGLESLKTTYEQIALGDENSQVLSNLRNKVCLRKVMRAEVSRFVPFVHSDAMVSA